MEDDITISQKARLKHIYDIAGKLSINNDDLELYGNYKAKICPTIWPKIKNNPDGKLILVTAINPTSAGEGKTTTSVGLGDAIGHCLDRKVCIALREPSLGPCFGTKGGATGGGYAQIAPMEDINLRSYRGWVNALAFRRRL